MRFMQTEWVLQTKNQSGLAKNWFSVTLIEFIKLGEGGMNNMLGKASHLIFFPYSFNKINNT